LRENATQKRRKEKGEEEDVSSTMQIIKEEIDFFLVKRRGLMMGFMTLESSSEVLPNPDIPYQNRLFFYFIL
jgi:hypothetical protein